MAAAPEQPHQPGVGEAAASSAFSSPPAIRVLDTAVVHPSPAGGPAPPETSLPLTFYDVVWLHFPPVQRVLFYRLAPDAVVNNLRDSLSHAVSAFFPLAGRLRLTPGTANRHELHYSPGDAVVFTVAEYDDDVDSLAADEPREVARIAPLAPPLPNGGAVLALQATLLPARAGRGLALGVTVHHAACDGAGSTRFLRTWAAAASNGAQALPPPPPVIDRALISDTRGLYDVFCPPAAPTGDEVGFVPMPEHQLLATFTLSRDNLQRIKDAVAAAAAAHGVAPPPRCTSLVATLGFVWSCYHRAKLLGAGGDQTYFLLSVDHRSRLNPPLPAEYLGNCVAAAIAVASRTELSEEPVSGGGLLAACAALAAGIEDAVSGRATETMGSRMQRVIDAAASGSLLTVAGSPRFRVYDLDMGFGPPAKVDVVSVARTGAVAVAESRAGGGGIEVGVALPPEGMDAFRKCFADALAELRLHAEAHQ